MSTTTSTGTGIDLTPYDWIILNISGGKDSQTMLRQVVLQAREQEIPMTRLVCAHQELGTMEWKGTYELAEAHARHYGLSFMTAKYRNKDKQEIELLDYVEQRGMWPSNAQRYCTSEFKRGPGGWATYGSIGVGMTSQARAHVLVQDVS